MRPVFTNVKGKRGITTRGRCVVVGVLVATFLLGGFVYPVSAANTHYYWDNVYFVEGQYIKFPHPDRDFYGISPYQTWVTTGAQLEHEQFDQSTSRTMATLSPQLLGLAIGTSFAGPVGALVGAVLGYALGQYIQANALDESGCMWLWISKSFVYYVAQNAGWLALYSILFWPLAFALVLSNLGYLRVGSTTYWDALGIGGPRPPAGGGGGGGCPYLLVYDGSQYLNEGLLDIHTGYTGQDLVTSHVPTTLPQSIEGMYLLALTEHPKTISHIDQVKLYANLNDGTRIQLPLLAATHSELGNVLPQLLRSDDRRVVELGANWNNGTSQSINLVFLAPQRSLHVTSYIFVIEGYNAIPK